jgi:hypothetical protein
MRILMILGWLMVPVLIVAYHYGPGQERMQLDRVAAALSEADQHAANKEWAEAVAKYDDALHLLPSAKTQEARRIRLERAKAQMLSQKLPEANADLQALLAELKEDAGADQNLIDQTRSALANSQYYMTWLMRLEGLQRDLWEPEIESARQNYRLLAEQADKTGDIASAQQCREDLESAVRLARMDLSELQGLRIPCQCQCNGSCRSRGKSNSKTPGPKDARGASSGPPPDNSGS